MNTLIAQTRPARPLAVPIWQARTIAWTANGLALLATCIVLRYWRLDHIPGLNGDEAWYGEQALRMLDGAAVQLRTPTGNPVNPFYMAPLTLLHAFFPPSVTLLRAVALASGLAALVVNFLLCRRTFDQPTAVVSTLILALLPINIAYSRFGWDASQSLLATLPVMYLALSSLRKTGKHAGVSIAAMVACMAAVVVHPTNVFAAVFLAVPLVFARRAQIVARLRSTRLHAKTWVWGLLIVATATIVLAAWQGGAVVLRHGPGEIGPFARGYLRLFSGATIFEFISGAGVQDPSAGWHAHTTIACDAAWGLVVVAGMLGMVRRLDAERSEVDVCLLMGWSAMLLAFGMVAGPAALAPHLERYAIVLVGPGALLVARGLCWWFASQEKFARRLTLVLALAAWLWPIGFFANYFAVFQQTGGLSHHAFRTAAIEPKRAALDYLLRQRRGGRPLEIVCHEWWSYWPLAYLAHSERGVRVIEWERWIQRGADSAADTWFVEFFVSPAERQTLICVQPRGGLNAGRVFTDFGDRPLLSVFPRAENR